MAYLTFFATIWFLHLAALLSPGANTLLLFQIGASSTVRMGMQAVFGITLAETIWVSLAALGISAVFETFPGVYMVIRIAGGLYLIYLGLRLWSAAQQATASEIRKWQLTPAAAFRVGFLTNITNPKTTLFFGSVYAASFTPGLPATAKYAAVALAVVTAFLWHAMLAFLFSRHLLQRSYTNARSVIDRVSGSVFVIIGCVLIIF
jgi:threonine efflux protein